MKDLAIALAALYLRGGRRAVELRRSHWPDVMRVLRRQGCALEDAAGALRDAGFWSEALVLETPGLLEWSVDHVESGRVLSAADPSYPCRWLRVLGPSAPPALWQVGEMPALPTVSIVGSRVVTASIRRDCERVAAEAVRLGFAVVSGRAEGCDRAAAAGARKAGGGLIEILPHGIDLARASDGCLLSVCAPDESFSAASAMERNALIYAASSHTVVGHARFKEGGTWHGAMHAIRCRLSTLIVRRSEDVAMRSMVALGGVWLDSADNLASCLRAQGPQGQLFDSAV